MSDKIEYDEAKRRRTLDERGLDFADAARLLAGPTTTTTDDRRDYGEVRYLTVGALGSDVVMVVWTPRAERRRIISMRKCNAEERAKYFVRVGRTH